MTARVHSFAGRIRRSLIDPTHRTTQLGHRRNSKFRIVAGGEVAQERRLRLQIASGVGARCAWRASIALDAGTYSTQRFTPGVTYEVSVGWANYEDLPGNFPLVPPTGSLDGVDAGTSDYIGIYTSIAALAVDCKTVLADTGQTPADIAGWLAAEPALVVTDGGEIEVGGLDGLVLDLTLKEGAGVICDGLDFPMVPLFMGKPPSSLEHAMIPGLTMRLYLLAYGDGTLAIEVDDLAGGANFADYSDLVDSIRITG